MPRRRAQRRYQQKSRAPPEHRKYYSPPKKRYPGARAVNTNGRPRATGDHFAIGVMMITSRQEDMTFRHVTSHAGILESILVIGESVSCMEDDPCSPGNECLLAASAMNQAASGFQGCQRMSLLEDSQRSTVSDAAVL